MAMPTGEVAIAVDNTAKKATPVADNRKEEGARTEEDLKTSCEKLAKWLNRIVIAYCVLSVSLDPLFLYIPLINQDLKCVRLDNTIKIIALVSRTFTDLFYLGRIILQVCKFENCSSSIKKHLPKNCSSKSMNSLIESFRGLLPEVHEPRPKLSKEIWESTILVDIFAVLPLPQVAILIFFPKMRVSGSCAKPIINFLVMGQYVPRVLRIYLSCKKAQKPFKGYTPLWLKGLLNLFLYILASHVLGAFWYFFAAQQMMKCWKHACLHENGCVATTFDCHEDRTRRNITVLNNFCRIDPPNSTLFDFGIYLNVLQSGALWSTDYPLKVLNSFCWGLRNLSSFGSNLQPSFYMWEIAFAAFISIIGLILFVYLIGNFQNYVLKSIESVESQRRKNKLDNKIKQKDKEVESWLSDHGIPLSRKQEIMEEIKRELEGNSYLDVVREIRDTLGSKEIERCSRLSRLREVPLLEHMDKKVLIEITEKLKPEWYTTGQTIIERGNTLEKMLFIVEGLAAIVKAEHSEPLGAGDFYREEFLVAPLWTSEDAKPLNDESVKAIDHVQALVLYATDMASMSSRARRHLNNLRMLQKVEIFQKMEKQVLVAISKRLKPMNFNVAKGHILQENRPLKMMFFVNRGVVLIESDSAMDVNFKKTYEVGSFYGEELVHWVTTWVNKSFPAKLPLSPASALCSVHGGPVEILALTADDLKSVVSKFRSKFSTETALLTYSDQPQYPLTILKNVKALKTIDEKVLKEICEHLELRTYEDAYIIQKNKSMEMMFFIVSGVVSVTDGSSKNYLNEGELCPNHMGVDLIEHWLQFKSTSIPAELPTSPYSFWAIGEVKVQVLKVDDLAKVQPRIGS